MKGNYTMNNIKLWLSVKEFAPFYGRTTRAIYEQIRTNGFPFKYRRTRGDSGSILISAHDAGLVTAQAEIQARTVIANRASDSTCEAAK
jgi:hypothetical protein